MLMHTSLSSSSMFSSSLFSLVRVLVLFFLLPKRVASFSQLCFYLRCPHFVLILITHCSYSTMFLSCFPPCFPLFILIRIPHCFPHSHFWLLQRRDKEVGQAASNFGMTMDWSSSLHPRTNFMFKCSDNKDDRWIENMWVRLEYSKVILI